MDGFSWGSCLPKAGDGLNIIPLGGVGEFGMNLTIYQYSGRSIIVDAGVRFSDPRKLGTSAVIPDLTQFFAECGSPYCYILTHGHEDHIGAMPFLLQQAPAPVYGTRWTLELIYSKLNRLKIDASRFRFIVVEPGDVISIEDFAVEFIHVTHSIPMACALLVTTKEGAVYHSGDYKLDDDPILEAPTNWKRFQEIGLKGIDLFLGDSTNAEVPGVCLGEKSTIEPLKRWMTGVPGLVVCSTFSSNLWRLKAMIDACASVGRRFYVAGGGMELTLNLAEKCGLFQVPEGLRVDDEGLRNLNKEELLIIASGSQGEHRSAIYRLALGEFRSVKLEPGDRVIFSARTIPGNERQTIFIANEIRKIGVEVITPRQDPQLHVSGHAHEEDIKKLIRCLNPKAYIPKHGGYSQLRKNSKIAENLAVKTGVGTSDLICSGDIINLKGQGVALKGSALTPIKYVEAEGQGLLTPEVLRDRLKIGEWGLVVVTGVFEASKMGWLVEPEIDIVGLAPPEDLLKDICNRCLRGVDKLIADFDFVAAKQAILLEAIRVQVRRIWGEALQKKPVVLIKLRFI